MSYVHGRDLRSPVPIVPAHDPWRTFASARGMRFTGSLLARLRQMDTRAPRAVAGRVRLMFDAAVLTLAADLAHCVLSGAEGFYLRIERDWLAATRPDKPPSENPQRRHALTLMENLGLIRVLRGRNTFRNESGGEVAGHATVVLAADAFRAALKTPQEIALADFTSPEDAPQSAVKLGRAVAPEEAAEVQAMTEQVERINAHLAGADIGYSGPPITVYNRQGAAIQQWMPDLSKRRLHRAFAHGRLDWHGRLYGGDWMQMPSGARLEGLRIDGEGVVSLDVSSTFLQLAYALERAPVPPGDLYALREFPQLSGKVGRNEVLKVAMLALFGAGKPLTQWPADLRWHPLVRGIAWADFYAAVCRRHSAIVRYFCTGACHELTRMESDICITALLRLIDKGVTALPVHDCIIVPRSKQATAAAVLTETLRDHTDRALNFKAAAA